MLLKKKYKVYAFLFLFLMQWKLCKKQQQQHQEDELLFTNYYTERRTELFEKDKRTKYSIA